MPYIFQKHPTTLIKESLDLETLTHSTQQQQSPFKLTQRNRKFLQSQGFRLLENGLSRRTEEAGAKRSHRKMLIFQCAPIQ